MSKKTTTNNKIPNRSKKYSENFTKVQQETAGKEVLSIKEAVTILSSLQQPKFKNGASLEIHLKLNIDATKSDQIVRDSVTLPHGVGKVVKVAAFVAPELQKEAKDAGADFVGSEDLVEEIKKTQKIEFDKAVADPSTMKSLAAIARILGVAGVMPSPKNGTVGTNVAQMVSEIKKGKVDFKNDRTGNLHLTVGKFNKSFTVDTLTENVEAALEAIQKAKPDVIKKKFILKAYLSGTLTPSIRIV